MKRAVGALLLPLLALAACEDATAVCPATMDVTLFAPATSLQVAVIDSASGQSLLPEAHGRWIAGTQTDSLRHWNDALVAYGPAGRYAVAVEAPGYRPCAQRHPRARGRVRAADGGADGAAAARVARARNSEA